MAGSYRHITNKNNRFIGTSLLDNLGDAHEALEECYMMILHLTGGDKKKIFEAWRDGYHQPACNRLADPGTEEEYWE